MPFHSLVLCQKHSHQQDTGFLFSTSLPALVICALFDERHSDRYAVISYCGFSFFKRDSPGTSATGSWRTLEFGHGGPSGSRIRKASVEVQGF